MFPGPAWRSCSSPSTPWPSRFIPKEKTNYATGLINLARNIGGSIGISVVTTMLARRAQFHQNYLVSNLQPGNPIYRSAMHRLTLMFTSHGLNPSSAATQAQHMLYAQLQRQASMLSFVDNFRLMALLCVCVIPLMFIMRKTNPRKQPPAPAH